MAFGSDSIGLLFRLSAENKASGEIKEVKKDVNDLANTAEKGGNSAAKSGKDFDSFATSLGLSATSAAGLSSALPAIGAALVGVTAAAVAAATAIYSIVRATADAAVEIDNFARLTGFSVEKIQALKIAAEANGSSLSELEEIFESYIETLNDAAKGSDDAREKLTRLGVDADTAFKNPEATFTAFIKRINEIPDSAGRAAAAMDAFGESGLPLLKTISEVNGDLDGYTKRLQDAGVIMDKETIAKSKELDRTLRLLQGQVAGAAFQFGSALTPLVLESARAISKFLIDNQGEIKVWANVVDSAVTSTINFIKENESAMRGFVNILGHVAEASTFGIRLIQQVDGALNGLLGRIGVFLATSNVQLLLRILEYFDGGTSAKAEAKLPDAPKKEKPYDPSDEKAKELAEKLRREREQLEKRDAAASIQLLENQKQRLKDFYDETKQSETEFFESGKVGFISYGESIKRAADNYVDALNELLPVINKLRGEGKTLLEQQAISDDISREVDQIQRQLEQDAAAAFEREKKREVEQEKKTGEEKVKIVQDTSRRSLAVLEAESRKRIAIYEGEGRAELDLIEKRGREEQDLISARITALQEELTTRKEGSQEHIDLINQIKVLEIDLQTARQETANQILEANRQIAEEELRQHEERLKRINEINERLREFREQQEQDLQNSIFNQTFDTSALEVMAQTVVNLTGIMRGAFESVAEGVGAMLESWILTGDLGPKAMQKLVASVLAGIAAQSAVLAIFELAKGFASLFFNPAEAAAHFKAAALFGSIAVVSAGLGREIAGDAFNQQTAGGFGTASQRQVGAGAGGNSSGVRAFSSRTDTEIVDVGRNAPSGSPLKVDVGLRIKDRTDWFSQMFILELEHNTRVRAAIRDAAADS
jgi:hypothetical protein